MTTLVALATKDAVVLGCDSLATTTRLLVDPISLADYFDPDNNFSMRIGDDGQPALSGIGEVFKHAQNVPYDHMTDVDKLMDLTPLPMGFMYTGITSIGQRTIKSLVTEFMERDDAFRTSPAPSNYTVKSIAQRLLKHLRGYYEDEFGSDGGEGPFIRPSLEFLLGGYDKQKPLPSVVRVNVASEQIERYQDAGVVFAGMMQEIQRVVHGVDEAGIDSLERRYRFLLNCYAARVKDLHGDDVEVPDLHAFMNDGFHLFGREDPSENDGPFYRPTGLVASWGDFSEQNAIDCVNYFIGIMREAHRFSSKMPTVGGPIHIALVTKRDGFRHISKEEYRHEDHRVERMRPRRPS